MQRLSEGFDSDTGRAAAAYEQTLGPLADELGELWGASDEEAGQRLALRCASEVLEGY